MMAGDDDGPDASTVAFAVLIDDILRYLAMTDKSAFTAYAESIIAEVMVGLDRPPTGLPDEALFRAVAGARLKAFDRALKACA